MKTTSTFKPSLKQLVEIEKRAAFLSDDAPRGYPDHFPKKVLDPWGPYSYDEFVGWSKHYWYQHSRSKENRNAAPENADELAGWLAREIFLTDD